MTLKVAKLDHLIEGVSLTQAIENLQMRLASLNGMGKLRNNIISINEKSILHYYSYDDSDPLLTNEKIRALEDKINRLNEQRKILDKDFIELRDELLILKNIL